MSETWDKTGLTRWTADRAGCDQHQHAQGESNLGHSLPIVRQNRN